MNAIRYRLDYIHHQLTAKSRHGTHSPFVYRLVDEVIYAKRRAGEPRDKVERLIERLIQRFKPRQVYRVGATWPAGQLDFAVFPADHDLKTNEYFFQELLPLLHQHSVLVVTDIYHGKNQKQFWKSTKTLPSVTITIDLFHAGIVFLHGGQAKEDFRIRF